MQLLRDLSLLEHIGRLQQRGKSLQWLGKLERAFISEIAKRIIESYCRIIEWLGLEGTVKII